MSENGAVAGSCHGTFLTGWNVDGFAMASKTTLHLTRFEASSPLGRIHVVCDERFIRAIDYEGYEKRLSLLLARHYGTYDLSPGSDSLGVISRLHSYFEGDLGALHALPLTTNGTEFQRRVWSALRAIPPGETRTYGALAGTLELPRGSRAVGLANRSNPIALAIPCHRVIGADGSLTGYAGGIERKQWLLDHERANRESHDASTAYRAAHP